MASKSPGGMSPSAGKSTHGFAADKHHARVSQQIGKIPGPTSGAMHGGGVVGTGGAYPGFATPGMNGYGEVKSGQKGHPGTD